MHEMNEMNKVGFGETGNLFVASFFCVQLHICFMDHFPQTISTEYNHLSYATGKKLQVTGQQTNLHEVIIYDGQIMEHGNNSLCW